MKNRTILHCDMNNFYASVECLLNPELREHPVAVCGDVEERHGIVLAKNYRAKAFGVSTGEAIWQAKQKCPGLIVVPPHYGEYLKFSGLAREIYGRYTDLVEPFGMDECWLDCTGSTRVFGEGPEIADEIRETVKRELGLTISVGVSFNKIFAKLGSDMKKPDAVTVIPRESFREIVWPLPAADLLGVGRATERKLTSFGIHTVGDLAAWPPEFYRSHLGKCGIELWRFANGEDSSPVVTRDFEVPDKTVGHGTTTVRDMENDAQVWEVMLELVQDIGHRLRTYHKRAGGVSVVVRDADLGFCQWQEILPQTTRSPSDLARECFALFRRNYRWKRPVRAVTVRAIRLVSESVPEQISLFCDPVRTERTESLDNCIEEIRRRFGKRAVRPGTLLLAESLTPPVKPNIIMPGGIPK